MVFEYVKNIDYLVGTMITVLFVLLLQILHWFWVTRRRPREPEIVLGGLPFIGHAHKVLGDPVELWKNFKDLTFECLRRGDALYFLIGNQKFYVLTDPDDIYTVSNTCFQKDTEVGELMKKLIGEGLVFADVPTWRKHRKIISPTFNQRVLNSYLPTFNCQGRMLVEELKKECGRGPFDHTHYLRLNSLKALCSSAMGVEIDDNEGSEYIHAYDKAVDNGMEKYQKFWLRSEFIYSFTALKKYQDMCIDKVKSLADTILYKKNQLKQISRISYDDNEIRKDKNIFLDHILNSEELSEEAIKEEVHSMLIAGNDTSSNVLLFAMLLIGSYPEVQDKINDELTSIFGDTDRDVLKEDMAQLTYLEAVLKETMRYYVMAPFVVRYIDKEVRLKNCTLQPGNNCFFSFYGVHRHEMWGKDADQFLPERWIENRIPSNCNAFAPFSLGKRNCLGRTYAMMLMKTTLVHVLRHYKIHADHSNIKLKLDILIKPVTGHYISVEKRKR